MAFHKQSTKIGRLAVELGWIGDTNTFIELLTQTIDQLPEPQRTYARRYYLLNDRPRKQDGHYLPEDHKFYNEVQHARYTLRAIFNLSPDLHSRFSELKHVGHI